MRRVGTAQLKDGAVTKPKLHDGAVTSSKVLNGSLGLIDLAPAARAPKAYADSNESQVQLPLNGTLMKVAQLDLPAGTWLLSGKSVVTSDGGAATNLVSCYLITEETNIDFANSNISPTTGVHPGYTQTLPLTRMIAGPLHVELSCSKANNAVTARVAGSRLVAVKVTP